MIAVLLLAVLAGCMGGDGRAADGTERGACYGNGTCNAGLSCLSDRCVRPPAADCDAVGERLASIELGNYAPKDERAARVLALAAICRAQALSEDDGACIVDARTKDELARCPKPLIVPPVAEDDRGHAVGLPASCTEYLRILDRYASCAKHAPDTARALRRTVDEMRKTWANVSGRMPAGVNDACAQGTAAIEQTMKGMGCH